MSNVESWTGNPKTLENGVSENMPQTSNGSMVIAYQNISEKNTNGTLQLASGGGRPETFTASQGTNKVQTVTRNFGAENLKLTNISSDTGISIWVAAVAPGYGSTTPATLPMDGSVIKLSAMDAAQGNAVPQWLTLRMTATSGQTTSFALIGGPETDGINAFVFELNSTSNSGPAQEGVPPKDGPYQATSKNSIDFQFNWDSARLYIVNLSGTTAAKGSVQVIGAG